MSLYDNLPPVSKKTSDSNTSTTTGGNSINITNNTSTNNNTVKTLETTSTKYVAPQIVSQSSPSKKIFPINAKTKKKKQRRNILSPPHFQMPWQIESQASNAENTSKQLLAQAMKAKQNAAKQQPKPQPKPVVKKGKIMM